MSTILSLLRRLWLRHGLALSLSVAMLIWAFCAIQSHRLLEQTIEGQQQQQQQIHQQTLPGATPHHHSMNTVVRPPVAAVAMNHHRQNGGSTSNVNNDAKDKSPPASTSWTLPAAFESILQRAHQMQNSCLDLPSPEQQAFLDTSRLTKVGNESFASLPSFGVIETLEAWKSTTSSGGGNNPQADALIRKVTGTETDTALDWACQLPPEHECDETMLTIVIMAYNPARLQGVLQWVKTFLLEDENWQQLIAEVVLVWNGERSVKESPEGRELENLATTSAFRIVYPLQMGLENDLMNRYHPKVIRVEKTKGILYYDDDGPFYSYAAVQAALELWKRHARAQIAAMSRHFITSPRQQEELQELQSIDPGQSQDKQFVAHCTNVGDKTEYEYHYFANYDAHMALPSGSILHVNYLCFLWHPVLEEVRQFVRAHPVHPDDVTVSMIVSQLSGRSPRVYSKRLKPPSEKDQVLFEKKWREWNGSTHKERRRLSSIANEVDEHDESLVESEQTLTHRRLEGIGGVNWDEKLKKKGDKKRIEEMEKKKQFWADLRTQAVNSVVRYFGSLSGGSIGWCEGTPFYNPKKAGRCDPIMAKQGWLPWMQPDGSPPSTCP